MKTNLPEEMFPPLLFITILSVVLLYIYVPYMWKWAREGYRDYHIWKQDEKRRQDELENARLRKRFYERQLMYGRISEARCAIDPEHLEFGQIVYTYRTDRPFYITAFGGRYGLDCSTSMICYTNIFDTEDAKMGTIWHLEEDIFLKQFYTYGENIHDYNREQIRSMAN